MKPITDILAEVEMISERVRSCIPLPVNNVSLSRVSLRLDISEIVLCALLIAESPIDHKINFDETKLVTIHHLERKCW